MKRLFVFFSLFLLGCTFSPFSEPEPLYRKEIVLKNAKIEWYYFSLFGGNVADYLVIKYSDSLIDTICQSTNICSVGMLGDDTIKVSFKSIPRLYSEPVSISKQIRTFKILIDTNGKTQTDSIVAELLRERDSMKRVTDSE